VYNLECELEKRIRPKSIDEKKENIILDFAWSNKQNRVYY
jgi:hypothetical protein